MKFTDAASLSGTKRTADGYLVAEAFAVRTGIQLYAGREVGMADRDMVRVYRPEDEVRSPKSLATFSHAPVTLGHPTVAVTTDNWAALAKGEVSTEAMWDGNKIKLPLIVKDAAAIAAIEGGTRELSAGYTCQLDFTSGITTDGQAYDAVQRDIRINHLAIVPAGRAGSECRIGDAGYWGAEPIHNGKVPTMADAIQTRTVLIDGLSVVTTDAGAQALEKLQKALADAGVAMTAAEKKAAEEAAAKEAAMAAKDAQIEALTKAKLSDADIDARVAARADLIGKAKTVAKDVATAGLSDAAIRKAAVVAVLGDAAVSGKSDAYIDARFDILAEDAAKGDPLAKVTIDSKNVVTLDTVYAERNAALEGAWKKGA